LPFWGFRCVRSKTLCALGKSLICFFFDAYHPSHPPFFRPDTATEQGALGGPCRAIFPHLSHGPSVGSSSLTYQVPTLHSNRFIIGTLPYFGRKVPKVGWDAFFLLGHTHTERERETWVYGYGHGTWDMDMASHRL